MVIRLTSIQQCLSNNGQYLEGNRYQKNTSNEDVDHIETFKALAEDEG